MSGPPLRLGIVAATTSVARSIAATARLGRLIILTHRPLGDLIDELGSLEAAFRHLHRVSENANRPIGVNVPSGEGTSRTVFIAPRAWTTERLQGWIAGHHQEIEAAFGPATVVSTEDL